VTGRISKFTYGVSGTTRYDPFDPEHVRRVGKSYLDAMGDRRIPGYFFAMLHQVRHA
jgi:hypothetical protein